MVFTALLDTYGFRGSLPIIGAGLLNICISAALYRPLAVHVRILRAAERPPPTSPLLPEAAPGPATRARGGEEGHRPGEAAGPRFHCGSIESDFALSRTPRSIHSSFDSISMMSSVSTRSQDKVADPGQAGEGEEEEEEEEESGAHDTITSLAGARMLGRGRGGPRAAPRAACPQGHWSGRASPSGSGMGEAAHCAAPTTAKSLSLRELAIHQIGSHLSLYRSLLVGEARRGPPAHTAQIQPTPERGRRPPPRPAPASAGCSRAPSRTSLMFSCEDFFVDSTCVLKDSRHPSHSHLHTPGGSVTHRLVHLSRTHSAAGPGEVASRKSSARQRFYSESTALRRGSVLSRHSSFCRQVSAGGGLGDRVSLIGSSELVAEVTEPARKKFTIQQVHQPAELEEGSKAEAAQEVVVKRRGFLAAVNRYINLALIRNPVFLVLAGSVMLMAVGVPHCLFFLPTHVKLVGLPSSDASLLLSLSAIFDLTGRILFGFFLDRDLVPKYLCYAGMMLLAGMSAILLASSSTFASIAACMALYGVGSGGWFLMVPLLLAEHLGVENIGSSYGLARLFQSSTNLSGPLVAGALFQRTGGMAASFRMMGASMVLGGGLVLLLPCAARRAAGGSRGAGQ
jgi:hypothetical protein